MRAVSILEKKRDGHELTQAEINWFVEQYTNGELPDYQAAAFLMAVCIRGMSRAETVNLTLAMARSGEVLRLADILGSYAVDKHSSGGVGDKTTLVVLPLVAACGVPVAKMSGRGLGYSGGTLDKLEAIAGYDVNLSTERFEALARQYGIVLSGQTRDLAPADGKLYALRDVTGTVPSLPLIASSIMSKKIAAGADGIVLDVKMGVGAFMPDLESARQLAQMMVDIGVDAGRDMIAVISDMNQPLGQAVGHALEVTEAIATLQGGGPNDFREHCLEVAGYMLKLAGQGKKWTEAATIRELLVETLENGKALDKFRQLVAAQGGDVRMVDDPANLPQASEQETIMAQQSGYVKEISALQIAQAAFELGAGREKKGDPIDLAVGLKVLVNVGDSVEIGAPLVEIHANNSGELERSRALVDASIQISAEKVDPLPLFYDTLYGD